MFSIVAAEEANQVPYPYVYVAQDGTFRELKENERMYLEEPFHPADGGRPYVKQSYASTTRDGNISGFLNRKYLPKHLLEEK